MLLLTIVAVFLAGAGSTAGEPRPVSWKDVPDWKHIPAGSATLSKDGQWFAYWYSPNQGNSELILQSTTDDTRKSFPIGETSGMGSNAIAFSEDSKHLAFIVYPEKGARANGRPATKLTLLDIAAQKENTFDNVKNFAFSGENPGWIAIHLDTPKPGDDKKGGKGTNLLLINLGNGSQMIFGNISEYAFDKKGAWLAMLTDAYDKVGNGLQLRNMQTGLVLAPETGQASFRHLNWTKQGDGLAILKGTENKDFTSEVYTVIAFRNFRPTGPEKIVFDPHEHPGFPENMSISPNYSPRWSDNLATLFFGIHPNEKKAREKQKEKEEEPLVQQQDGEMHFQAPANRPQANNAEKNDVIIWHWQDSRLQSVQRNRETSDRNFSFLSAYHVKENQFVRLADEDLRNINIAPGQQFGLGIAGNDYELWSSLSGENFADIYMVDLITGERHLLLEKLPMQSPLQASPDGQRFVYYREGHYYTYHFASGLTTPLTRSIPSLFTDLERDTNVQMPPTPFIGWSSDSREVLIRDNYNIWKISIDGKKFENLTLDGRPGGKRYMMRYRLDPEEEGIDMRQPLFVRVLNEGNKQAGIARIDRGRQPARMLINGPEVFSNLIKAKDKDIYLFTRESVTQAPDYYVASNAELSGARKLTDIYPEQKDFVLSAGSVLINYVSEQGDSLQAALFLPANYQPGQSYPTVVYIYERLTQGLNSYTRPSLPGGGFNRSMYTSNGYAVLMPDIVYKLNDPGMSALWCVLPALDAAIATGVVDQENVAIHGHSWGGYQTSFLITQTNRFKAAVAGAPLTNMISMYSLIYWNTGGSNQAIFETSQGRLFPGYWDNREAFERNSPVYFAQNVNTPLLLMHNDKDGAVDFTQGIEYYNTLRRMEKPVIMLQYEGENHGLRKPANQIDYALRMMEFLDHHLKGSQAPEWMVSGVPRLELKKHIEERASLMMSH